MTPTTLIDPPETVVEPAAHANAALVQPVERPDALAESASVSLTVAFKVASDVASAVASQVAATVVFQVASEAPLDDDHDDPGEANLPAGIDFDRWTGLVQPASRDTYRDSLDLLEFEDE